MKKQREVNAYLMIRGISIDMLSWDIDNHVIVPYNNGLQGNTEEELPEFLLGTCRLNHLDVSKSVPLTDDNHKVNL